MKSGIYVNKITHNFFYALCFPSILLSIYQYTCLHHQSPFSLVPSVSFFLSLGFLRFFPLSKFRTILFYGIAIAIVAIFIYSFSDVKCVSWLFCLHTAAQQKKPNRREQNERKPRITHIQIKWARVRAAKIRAHTKKR